ncbi:MAG: hypothetical protein J7L96_09720, partial [Bacteroidales bacterium]|nr:hypothetical protein [Bacteroidales bacterium]
MKVRPYRLTDHNAWNGYVTRHPEGSIFHLIQWRNVVVQTFQHQAYYLVAEADKTKKDLQPAIIGVLPLFHIKSTLFGNYLVSIPFAELGGILADSKEIADKLLTKAIELTKSLNLDYLELRQSQPLSNLPTKSLYYNFSREIFPNLEDNMQAIPRKARRMIRQGEKYGLK